MHRPPDGQRALLPAETSRIPTSRRITNRELIPTRYSDRRPQYVISHHDLCNAMLVGKHMYQVMPAPIVVLTDTLEYSGANLPVAVTH